MAQPNHAQKNIEPNVEPVASAGPNKIEVNGEEVKQQKNNRAKEERNDQHQQHPRPKEVEVVGEVNVQEQIHEEDEVPRHIMVEQKIIDYWNDFSDWLLLRLRYVFAWVLAKWRFMMIPVYAGYNQVVVIWNRQGDSIKKFLLWFGLAILVILVLRMLVMINNVQDNMEEFQTFVKEKDRKVSKILDSQGYHVGDMYDTQEGLQEKLRAVENKTAKDLASHNGELVEIKSTLVEVKSEFENVMLQSQMKIMELQEENQKMQKEMMDMQDNMNQKMEKVGGDVNAVRGEYQRLKHSLDSIDYNVQKIKDCGFWRRLFGFC